MSRRGPVSTPVVSDEASHQSVVARLQWMLALGTVEFLAVSLWLDTDRVVATGLWRLVLKKLPDGILFGLVTVGLAVMLGGMTAWTTIRQEIRRRRIATTFPWVWYGAHLAAFLGFLVLSWQMVAEASESNVASAGEEGLRTGLWIASGLAATVAWLVGLLPLPLWKPALAKGALGLAAAVPITVAAWGISRWARDSWRSFSEPTLNAVLFILQMCGQSPVHDPSTYAATLGRFTVEIDPNCSGYQGFGIMAVFSVAYVWAFRRRLRFPQAWLLVPLALVASLVGNVIRIAVLLVIGAYVSPEIALGGFHSHAGWLFLIVVAVLLVGVAQRLPWFCRDVPRAIDVRRSPVAACLTPFLLWQLLGIVLRLFAADPQQMTWYPLRVAALAVPLWYWREFYARLFAPNGISFIGILTGAAAYGLWMLLEGMLPVAGVGQPAALVPESVPLEWRPAWLAARIIGHCLAAPFVEELAFRGYLMRRLQAFRFNDVPFRATAWAGIFISSLLFGALHGERWLAGNVVALVYAVSVRQTGRLATGFFAHATTNFLVTAYVLTTGDAGRWH
jgi:exosortase E/protease (VPEID-CTERM system)